MPEPVAEATRHPVPDAALDAHMAIIGKTGSGKSHGARGIVERLLDAGRRVVVLDPVGVWYGLRADQNGRGDGYPIAIFGGEHGDRPLDKHVGHALGGIIGSGGLSAIIDTSEMGVGERERFLTGFLEALYKTNRAALWLVLEEADEAAPQSVRHSPQSAQLLNAVDRIARRGRSRGFRLISITQRPAVLHKNILTQTQTMIAHRVTAPQDRNAIKAWVDGHGDADAAAEVIGSLARLGVGEAWVWAPDLDVLRRERLPLNKTFDSSAAPSADEKALTVQTLREVDLSAYEAALGAEAETEATAGATKRAPGATKPDPEALRAAEARGFERGRDAGYFAGLSDGKREGRARERARIMAAFEKACREPDEPGEPAFDAAAAPPRRAPTVGATPHRTDSEPAATAGDTPRITTSDGEAPALATRLLDVLDTNPPIRLSWAQVCALAGRKPRGGSFNAARKYLREAELILEDGELVRIAAPSAAAETPADPAARAEAMLQNWRSVLGGRAADVLDVLRTGATWKRTAIAQMLGVQPRGGNWNAIWKVLRDNELVVVRGDHARLADWLL